MNLSEFKAWFEGFTENLGGSPNTKAWKRICDKVKTITPDPTPLPTFVERYRPYYPNWYGWTYFNGIGQSLGSSSIGDSALQLKAQAMQCGTGDAAQMTYAASDAFRDLGRLDAQTNT